MIKKRYLTAISTMMVLLSGCAREPAQVTQIELTTFDQKLSYLFAFDSASQVKDLGIILDVDVVRQGVIDVNNGVESKLSAEEIEAVTRAFRLKQLELNEN